MKLSNELLREITQNLDCGMICYVNKKTQEIKSMADPSDIYFEEEFWSDVMAEVENNSEQYQKIEKMSSREAFEIMESFIEQVSDKEIKNRLRYALSRNKPFRNFKNEVDYNEDVRQHWFKYKEYRYIEWMKDYFDGENDLEKDIPNLEFEGITGYFDDEGNEYNPNLHPIPNLCLSCKKNNDSSEEMFCNLTRLDQLNEVEFNCFAYEKIGK